MTEDFRNICISVQRFINVRPFSPAFRLWNSTLLRSLLSAVFHSCHLHQHPPIVEQIKRIHAPVSQRNVALWIPAVNFNRENMLTALCTQSRCAHRQDNPPKRTNSFRSASSVERPLDIILDYGQRSGSFFSFFCPFHPTPPPHSLSLSLSLSLPRSFLYPRSLCVRRRTHIITRLFFIL